MDYLNYSCVAVVVGYLFKCSPYFNIIFLSVNHFWIILIYNYSILLQTYKVFHDKLTCCPWSFLYFAFVFFHSFYLYTYFLTFVTLRSYLHY